MFYLCSTLGYWGIGVLGYWGTIPVVNTPIGYTPSRTHPPALFETRLWEAKGYTVCACDMESGT
jgi:hypothetical protein